MREISESCTNIAERCSFMVSEVWYNGGDKSKSHSAMIAL